MNQIDPVPPALQNRAFDTASARRMGVSRASLAEPRFEAPHHGIRVPHGTSDTVVGRARGLLPALGPKRYFSHETAVGIWGAPVPRRLDSGSPLHVTSIRPTDRIRRPGVVGHTSDSVAIQIRERLPVEGPELAWLHAAQRMSVDELVVAGDALVGRATGRVTDLDRLAAVVAGAAGVRGVTRARVALALVRLGAESPKETEVRLGLPPELADAVDLNVDVYDRGVLVGRPDLVFVDAMVTVEYEGDHHRTDRRTFRNDIARRRNFEDAGWRVFQITQDDLTHRRSVVRTRLSAIVGSRAGVGARLARERNATRVVAVRG